MRRGWKVFLMFLLLSMAVGCGNNNKKVDIDSHGLTQKLLATVKNDELTRLDSELIEGVYDIKPNQYEEEVIYISSGATAMEIALFKTKDKENLEKISKAIDKRKNEQIEIYKTYSSNQVPMLQGAIKKEIGDYVIYCVTEDAKKAEDIINEVIK